MLNPKPCPLCGEAKLKTWRTIIPSTPLRYQIECASCHCCGKKALTKWGAMKLNIDGNGYCCMVERSSQKHEPQCKIRRPDKVHCELYEAGNWATRFQKGRNNNA